MTLLCPNCGLTTHARCCSQCGTAHKPARLHSEHCSAKCDREAARVNRISVAMEKDFMEREKSNADALDLLSARMYCRWCGEPVNEHRVYFGVAGPFCNTDCRDDYAKTP